MLLKNYLFPILFIAMNSAVANNPEKHTAILEGHAILPAKTFVQIPNDAPKNFQTSGKFTTSKRVEKIESVEGLSDQRPTNVFLPFKGQPLQGHSGIKKLNDGTYWILTDNGAGNKSNSPDFMLYLTHYQIDFEKGKFNRLKTIFLHDPDKKIPFHIVNENTEKRYLTGADLDTESFQIINNSFFIGDEFGPYLIQTDMSGKVLNFYETQVNGKTIHSPDNYMIRTPGKPTEVINFEVKRSKGFEGMASSPDKTKLYPLLEGSLWNEKQQQYDNENGKQFLLILEFDTTTKQWTNNFWKYPLESNDNAIGDFNMIDDTHGLVIERDNGEGIKEKACLSNNSAMKDCFNNLPKFKRIYLIKFTPEEAGKNVKKLAYIDLLDIKDPNKKALKPLSENTFKFPFFTIENVDIVDDKHIIVGNDNNLPFSSSRNPNQADDNEMILLNVESFLKAKQ